MGYDEHGHCVVSEPFDRDDFTHGFVHRAVIYSGRCQRDREGYESGRSDENGDGKHFPAGRRFHGTNTDADRHLNAISNLRKRDADERFAVIERKSAIRGGCRGDRGGLDRRHMDSVASSGNGIEHRPLHRS